MLNIIAKSILAAAFLQVALFADPVPDPEQDQGWDCPGTGYLPFRHELLVTTDELARMIDSSEATVVHVGFDESVVPAIRRARYSDGHIPGARHLKWPDLKGPGDSLLPAEARLDALGSLGISPGRRVVLYDTGLGLEAAAAFAALGALGLADSAALLDGQWVKWVSEGRPLCRWLEEVAPSAPEFRPRATALSLLELRPLLPEANLPEPAVTILDARAGAGRSGQPPFVKMCWTDHFANLNLPVLKKEVALRRLWAPVPARSGQRVVVAAKHWREAAHVYFIAKLLGYSVQLFDGSIEQLEDPKGPGERGS